MKTWLSICCIFTISIVTAQLKPKEALPVSAGAEMKQNSEQSFWEVIKNRRSVRAYTSDPVPEADVQKMIDAARLAPTSGNQQPWKFLIIRDTSKIHQMKDLCITRSLARFDSSMAVKITKEQYEARVRKAMTNYFSAPVYIIVLTDNNSLYPDYNHWDGPMAAGYLMLAARALGYGTVFITDAIPEEVTKEVFRIPDSYTRVCITPVGVPAEWPQQPPKKSAGECIIQNSF